MGLKVCVVGAGAIGGWIAARLALAGEDVGVLARGATLARISANGIELHSEGRVDTVRVRNGATAADLGPQDVVIVATKAYALPGLAETVRSLMHPRTIVLPLANGLPWWYFLPPGLPLAGLRLRNVDPHGALERAIALPQVLGLSVVAACHSPEPGVVKHSAGSKLVLGEPAGGLSERVETIAQLLKSAGFDAVASSDIRRDIWFKLLGNACFNPLSLLTGAANDELIEEPRLHPLFVQMISETLAVGARLGLTLDIDPVQRIAQARKLGRIKTSMLQDFEGGRPIEIDAILGALVEAAAAVPMPVPQLETVLGLVRLRARTAGLLPVESP